MFTKMKTTACAIFVSFLLAATLLASACPTFAEDASNSGKTNNGHNASNSASINHPTPKPKASTLVDTSAMIASREATLKAKVQAFKDQVKAKTVLTVNDT